MNNELKNLKNPMRIRLEWAVLYSLILIAGVIGFLKFADHVRTHTIPAGQINISVQKTEYPIGEPVKVLVENRLPTTIYVGNDCPSEPLTVYRQENDKWVRIHGKAELSFCKLQDREIALAGNTSALVDFSPWQKMFETPGKYRVVAVVEHYSGLPYQDFYVIKPAAPAVKKQSDNGQTVEPSPQTPERRQDEPQNREQNDN